MKILMASSECVPFAKVGGLADVVGSLPKFLKLRNHDVRIIIPKYKNIESDKFQLKVLPFKLLIPIGTYYEEAVVWEGKLDADLPVYFVENDKYFNRNEIYGTQDGDYSDNRERFVFFSRTVLEACKALSFQADIIHCHDWQTGIIPAYLKTTYKIDGFFFKTATIYSIHNMAYQGNFDSNTIKLANFSWDDFTWDKLEYFGRFNFMKAGLVFSDLISTVSPSYAKEIQTKAGGRGMDGILKHRHGDIIGILNGIDYQKWDPTKDNSLISGFSQERIEGKIQCKQDLQKICKLEINPTSFIIGSVSRLDSQKGYDLIAKIIPKIMHENIQMVMLGRGDKSIQETLSKFAKQYPHNISVHFEFNEELAHKIFGGSDAFLMPSRFEPCGLSQMISLAYGTIPIVNKTGGLADTIVNFNYKTCKGNGFVFSLAQASQLKMAILRAKNMFQKKEVWKKIMHNAFQSNFSWKKSVEKYINLYKKAIKKISN